MTRRWPLLAAAWLAAGLMGCTIALDFGPGVLLPSLDGGGVDGATRDALPADVATEGGTPSDVERDAGCTDEPCVCAAGRGDCDRLPSNGCETDLATTAAHCGACDHACGGSMTCTAGECGGGRCPSPNVECGTMCADLQSEARHCGACGVNCGPGAPRCCRGACTNAPRCL